ncbi:MAG: DUF5103 domain-containing protein [Bacteroidetes bacterium]|nr:DUF5103 domain-containing protein [Bacteroidota bacterium]MBS1541047.1 DUF5103 domain-containing protein [Bacteroidota bacterium]
MKYFAIALAFLSFPSIYAQPAISFDDKIYETQIRTVQLYPNLGGAQDFLQPSSTPVQQQNLLLAFDDFQEQRNNYYAKLIHCNYDWTKSNLADLEFLDSYNEFPINDYALSGNTHEHYIHYRFQVPAVKYPGNYLLIVYRDDIKSIILSKRMMIFDTQISITKDNQQIGTGALNWQLQPLNFIINYNDVEILNPTESVHVNIRQNQRWDNVKVNVQPSFVRDDQSQLEYKNLDDSKQFYGGSEFRFVDFRSLNAPGVNTGMMIRKLKPYELYVLTDVSRGIDVYSQTKDNDGNFIIDNLDYGEPDTNGNYLYVNFSLKADAPYDGDVYLVGKFNNYQRSQENKMTYKAATGLYESRQYLKQGYYEYQYVIESKTLKPYTIEGSHFETQNVYEVAVYNRPFRPNADLLIGYALIQINPR